MPKPPKKDVKKVFSNDQYILRFEAKLISESREDNDRKFVVSFFCGRLLKWLTKIQEFGQANIWKECNTNVLKLVNSTKRQISNWGTF
jgi:transaldolase